MANYTSVHTGAVVDASVTKVSASGVTQADLTKLNAVTSTAAELNILDGVTATYTEINVLDGITASTAELNILDGVTANATELNYLDGADPSINTLVLPDNTTISIFGASLIDDADAASARTTLNVDVAGTDNSTDVTLNTTSYDYLSLSGQQITLGQINISDDTNLVAGTNITLSGDTLNVDDAFLINSGDDTTSGVITAGGFIGDVRGATKFLARADVALAKGDAVYISGVVSTTPTVALADANDASKMPSFGLAATSAAINDNVEIITFGTITGVDTSAFSAGDILYISTAGTTGNTLTATPPSGESSLIQNIGIVQRVNPSVGSIKVGGAGRTNATPNLNDGNIFIGNGSNQVTTASLNTKIETYLDGGTSSPNFASVSIGGTAVTATATELNILDGADADLNTLSLPASTTISTFGASLVDDLDASAARTTLGVDPAGTDNSTDVTLAGSLDYLTIAGQVITRNAIDLAADVSGILPLANGGTGASTASGARTNLNVDVAGTDNSTDVTLVTTSHDYLSIAGQAITLGTIDISDDTNLVGGTGITLTGDTLSTTDSEIVHDSLSGFVANEHIDHSTVSITAGTGLSGGGDLTLTRTLSTNDSEIVHDNLSGFLANEHIDHSGVTITAGSGLTGGGDITTTRTLNVGAGTHITVNADDVAVNTSTLFSAPAFTGTATGVNLTLSGDLTVNGTTTTLNTTNVAVTDNLIELNQGTTSNANDSGILIERGTTGDNAIIMWDESADKFTVGTTTATASATGDIVVSTGTLVANVEGNLTGNVTGNADTATALATGRTISLTGDVTGTSGSFDGTGNVSIAATIAANSVALGTDTTGNYMSDLTEGAGIDITHTPGEGSNATITLDLTEVGFGGGANRLITDDGDGTVTAEANLTFDGTHLYLPDSSRLRLGTDIDLQLYHDGTNSFIKNDAGSLYIDSLTESDTDIFVRVNDGGVTITAIQIDASEIGQVRLPNDGQKLSIGEGQDLQLHHTSNNSFIANSFTGDLYIQNNVDDRDVIFRCDDGAGGVTPYITLDGSATRTNVSKDLRLDNSVNLQLGSGGDMSMSHDGSNATFSNAIGNLIIQTSTDDGDVIFRSDDGLGGVTPYITLDGSTTDLLLTPPGNVGIGTSSPQSKLHTVQTLDTVSNTLANGNYGLVVAGDVAGVATDTVGIHLAAKSVGGSPTRGASILAEVQSTGNNHDLIFATSAVSAAPAERMRINSSGNVGIGSSSPGAKLHIYDAFPAVPELRVDNSNHTMKIQANGTASVIDSTATNTLMVRASGSTKMTILNSGNVGIGTESPASKLHINGSSNGAGIVTSISNTYYAAASTDEYVQYQGEFYQNDVAALRAGGYIRIGKSGDFSNNANASGHLVFATRNAGTLAERMRIDSSGNVGIGTASPTEKLQVNGRINIENSGALALAPSASTTLYSASGELYVHDAADNVTLLSPHNFSLIPGGASEDRAWSYFSQKPIRDEEGNVTHTQKVNVDMMKLARLVEQLTGEKLVYTEEDENG